MKLKNYLKYSGIWMGIVFNPFHWEFKFTIIKPSDLDPNARGMFLSFAPVWIRVVIDDGSY